MAPHQDWPLSKRFPELSADWFARNNAVDPQETFNKWLDWIDGGHRPNVLFKKSLELCAGVSAATVTNFLAGFRDPQGDSRSDRLGDATRARLRQIADSLGWEPQPVTPSASWKRTRRLVLFTDLGVVGNPRFHLQVLDSLIQRCATQVKRGDSQYSVAIETIRSSDEDVGRSISQALFRVDPEAVIWFRLTPNRSAVDGLVRFKRLLPAVVIHGDRVRYPYPIIAHIQPDYGKLAALTKRWADTVFAEERGRTVAVATMAPEEHKSTYPAVDSLMGPNLRNSRIQEVQKGLSAAGMIPKLHHVRDFTASGAIAVVEEHRSAAGFVCLSDELAAAVRHLLRAGSYPELPILGFDGSASAQIHHMTTIDQQLDQIGEKSIRTLTYALDYLRKSSGILPGFHEVKVDLRLVRY